MPFAGHFSAWTFKNFFRICRCLSHIFQVHKLTHQHCWRQDTVSYRRLFYDTFCHVVKSNKADKIQLLELSKIKLNFQLWLENSPSLESCCVVVLGSVVSTWGMRLCMILLGSSWTIVVVPAKWYAKKLLKNFEKFSESKVNFITIPFNSGISYSCGKSTVQLQWHLLK